MEKQTKIFLVENDLFSFDLYRRELQQMGFENIFLFLNGTTCLNNLSQKPEIIFLGHNIDDYTKLEVLKKIKCFDLGIYVIMVSVQENIQFAMSALKIGAFDFITKDHDTTGNIKKVIRRIHAIKNN